jgi:hypothetical protein
MAAAPGSDCCVVQAFMHLHCRSACADASEECWFAVAAGQFWCNSGEQEVNDSTTPAAAQVVELLMLMLIAVEGGGWRGRREVMQCRMRNTGPGGRFCFLHLFTQAHRHSNQPYPRSEPCFSSTCIPTTQHLHLRRVRSVQQLLVCHERLDGVNLHLEMPRVVWPVDTFLALKKSIAM